MWVIKCLSHTHERLGLNVGYFEHFSVYQATRKISLMDAFARDTEPTNVEELRERLRKMSDTKLVEFGKAAAYMCSPEANMNKRPREAFLVQLAETRAEWRRRQISREQV